MQAGYLETSLDQDSCTNTEEAFQCFILPPNAPICHSAKFVPFFAFIVKLSSNSAGKLTESPTEFDSK